MRAVFTPYMPLKVAVAERKRTHSGLELADLFESVLKNSRGFRISLINRFIFARGVHRWTR
jgi:hypothetical protein